MRVGIWKHLFGSRFRFRVHWIMRCCGREISNISLCTERQVGTVIVVFLMSASQVYFVSVRRWSRTAQESAAFLCIFSKVPIVFWVYVFQDTAPYYNLGLTSIIVGCLIYLWVDGEYGSFEHR